LTVRFYRLEDGPPPLTVAERDVYQHEIDDAFARDPAGRDRAQAALDANKEPLLGQLLAEAWDDERGHLLAEGGVEESDT
jgi:hypothetical protein